MQALDGRYFRFPMQEKLNQVQKEVQQLKDSVRNYEESIKNYKSQVDLKTSSPCTNMFYHFTAVAYSVAP